MSDRYCISYDGDEVVNIPGVGLFQRGTSAWVTENVARDVLGRGERWSCVGPDGAQLGAAPQKPKEEPKAEAPKAEPVKAEAPKAEPAKAEAPKAEPAKAEAPKADAPKSDKPAG